MDLVFAGDIVEENGKSVRENNLERQHRIPLGTLVEIFEDDPLQEDSYHRLRLYVVDHARDCDGTPLYSLSFNKKVVEELRAVERDINTGLLTAQELQLSHCVRWNCLGAILNGFPEESLMVLQ